jgi:hypothetical protein
MKEVKRVEIPERDYKWILKRVRASMTFEITLFLFTGFFVVGLFVDLSTIPDWVIITSLTSAIILADFTYAKQWAEAHTSVKIASISNAVHQHLTQKVWGVVGAWTMDVVCDDCRDKLKDQAEEWMKAHDNPYQQRVSESLEKESKHDKKTSAGGGESN